MSSMSENENKQEKEKVEEKVEEEQEELEELEEKASLSFSPDINNPNTRTNDTILELQLGDVIHITNPVNDELNDQNFIIDYIDKTKAYLINTDTMNRIRVDQLKRGYVY